MGGETGGEAVRSESRSTLALSERGAGSWSCEQKAGLESEHGSDGARMSCCTQLWQQRAHSWGLYLSIFCLCCFTPPGGVTEGEIPALPLPRIDPDGFRAFPLPVMQNGCSRFGHTEYVMHGNTTAERGFKENPIHFLMFSSETHTVFAMPAQDTTYTKHYSRPWIWKLGRVKFTLGCK